MRTLVFCTVVVLGAAGGIGGQWVYDHAGLLPYAAVLLLMVAAIAAMIWDMSR